jgi:type IV fimbrial biogenesis protein FimT
MEDTGRSGFTLVELLVTLAVVALLVTDAAPAMAWFLDQARLRAAAQTLAQELRQARNHALSHQSTIHFSDDFPAVQLTTHQHSRDGGVVFSPLRGTATGTTFVLRNRHAEARVIVSPLGRIRICAPDGRNYPSC